MNLFTVFLLVDIIIECVCQEQSGSAAHAVPIWGKILAILGILLIIIAAFVYVRFNQTGYTNISQIFRDYIMPSQAEVTFVDFKSQNDPRVQQLTETAADKSLSFDEDLSKDEQMSIDQGMQSENRNLSSVFNQKSNKKSKKSKSRKRLANNARISENPNQQQDTDRAATNDL